MNKKYTIIILTLLLLSFIIYITSINSNSNVELVNNKKDIKQITDSSLVQPFKNKEENNKLVSKNTKHYNNTNFEKKFTWNDIGIEPLQSIEGANYVFTAFDYDEKNNELVVVGSYEKNKIIYIKDKKYNELEISDIPMDVIVYNDLIYILCINKFIVVENKKITTEFIHNINNITTFDKLLFFDNKLNILMSDGSSYLYTNNKFKHSKNLISKDNTGIWIQKTSPTSFNIETTPKNDKIFTKVNYTNNIGSITLLGSNIEKYYVILDVVQNTKPISITRELKCNKDNFDKTIIQLPNRKFSYIKNDIKLHKNTVYTAHIDSNNLTIKRTKI